MSAAEPHGRRQIATGLGLAAACLAFAFAGGLLSPGEWAVPSQSKTLFPALLLLGAAFAGLYIAAGATATADDTTPRRHLRALGMGLAAAAYAIALPHIGLHLSTAVLCTAVPIVLGYRNWLGIAAFMVLIIALAWLVFIRLMNVPLPL